MNASTTSWSPSASISATVREDHPLRHAGRAGGEEHRRGIAGPPFLDFFFQKLGAARQRCTSNLEQLVVAHQLRLRVVPHAARVVVVDALERRALRQDLEELVDLLLVLGKGEGDL